MTIRAQLIGEGFDKEHLCGLTNASQGLFRLSCNENSPLVRLRFLNVMTKGLFHFEHRHQLALSLWQVKGISTYLGWEYEAVLAAMATVAVVQWSTLTKATALIAEDFIHHQPMECIYAQQSSREQYALRLEKPTICTGCHYLFSMLGADAERQALLNAFAFFESRALDSKHEFDWQMKKLLAPVSSAEYKTAQ